MIVGAVTFENTEEEELNLEEVEEVRSCFYDLDEKYEIIDLKSLFEEANNFVKEIEIPEVPMKISNTSWISCCCINYVYGNLANCDCIFTLNSCLECPIASQVALLARIMGITCFYFEEKRYGTIVIEQKNPEIKLPYIDYEAFLANFSNLEDKNKGADEEGSQHSLLGKKPIDSWFKTQFGRQ